MELLLERDRMTDADTTGQLYELRSNGEKAFLCYVLEDRVRPVGAPKVYAHTAIPAGRYRIAITQSQRFKKAMPLLLDVPNFAGIRIHAGNDRDDTEGCLLPGLQREYLPTGQRVTQSRDAMARVNLTIQRGLNTGEVWITVR